MIKNQVIGTVAGKQMSVNLFKSNNLSENYMYLISLMYAMIHIFNFRFIYKKKKRISKTKHILHKSMQIYAKWELKTLILNHYCISNNIFLNKLWTKNVKEIPNIGENNYIVDSPIPGVNATTCIKHVFKGKTTMGETTTVNVFHATCVKFHDFQF